MKQLIILSLCISLFSACGNKGEALSEEFCQCVEEKNVLGCKELMTKHLNELDEDETGVYLQRTNTCIQAQGFK